jgi:GAF domain-containing protein
MFRLPSTDNLAPVLRAAVNVDDALGGLIQRVEENGRRLRVLEAAGLTPEYFDRFRVVDFGMSTSCSQAVVERRRVVIRDVRTDAAFAPYAADAVQAGYLAVQSTPLIDTQFRAIGVLSTYFPRPHHPGPQGIAWIEMYARVAALLLESNSLHEALVDAERQRRVAVGDELGTTRTLESQIIDRQVDARLEIVRSDQDRRHLFFDSLGGCIAAVRGRGDDYNERGG